MRTDDEIIDRVNYLYENDWLGVQRGDLIECLPFEKAKHFLNESAKEEGWNQEPRDRDSVIARMLGYMEFAWGKANDGRGISAGRSMDHYSSWVWLAGDDLGDLTEYEFYGKDNLCKICAHYGWDSSQWDDGVREN